MKRLLTLALPVAIALAVVAVQAEGSAAEGSAATPAAASAPAAARTPAAANLIRVPNVVGLRMDLATRMLRDRGLRVNEECSGLFGCIIKSRWWVCVQYPRAGRYLRRYAVVAIYGERRGEC
jgi:hypothetical protein